jgi:RHS repeat-associated protein
VAEVSGRVANRYQYTGREYDWLLGLQYNRARWYDAATGRWTSQDPLGFGAGDANLYRYAGNSPTNATDPSGNIIALGSALVGAAVGAGVGVAGAVISSWVTGEQLTLGKVAGGAVNGAIAGGVVGAAAGALSGDVSGLVLAAGIGGLGGALGGAVGNYTEQRIDNGTVNWDQVRTAGATGFVGGVIGGPLGMGVGAGMSKALGVNGMSCLLTNGQIAAQTFGQSLSGGITGMATDATMQVLTAPLSEFSGRRLLAAGLTGLLGGGAGYLGTRALMKACFAAGTPLLTPDGCKPIEEFRVGDLVLSRAEVDADGPVVAKEVQEVFERTGRVLHLHVGGQVIRTTAEHPFWVQGAGWLPADELRAGELLLGHDGQWVAVEEVLDTGEYERVYNLRIADYHTYFVGSEEWGFSVWAHNANYNDLPASAG